MRVFLACLTTMFLSACATTPDPPLEPVFVSDCSWVRPLTISEDTFGFIAQNIANPEVRKDVDQIVGHNESYEKFCGEEAGTRE